MSCILFFFFNDTATTEIYTLSLHDALPISLTAEGHRIVRKASGLPEEQRLYQGFVKPKELDHDADLYKVYQKAAEERSEEHTSELQSPDHLVCRLLLEKKKKYDTR